MLWSRRRCVVNFRVLWRGRLHTDPGIGGRLCSSDLLNFVALKSVMQFWTADAFTEHRFAGNPAAVFPVEQFPPDDLCQKIAAEMNIAETTFIEMKNPERLRIRWFTPTIEVKLCGHATLASAHVLFQEKLVQGDKIELHSNQSGILRVLKKEGKKLTLDFPLWKTGPSVAREPFDYILPSKIVNVVKAAEDILVEVVDEKTVRELAVPASAWAKFEARGIIVTAKGSGPYDFVSRFFAPRSGIDEDPVTGSAHCTLSYYWREKLNKSQFTAYQASSRGGVIEIEIVGERVFLTGSAVTVLKGVLVDS